MLIILNWKDTSNRHINE